MKAGKDAVNNAHYFKILKIEVNVQSVLSLYATNVHGKHWNKH